MIKFVSKYLGLVLLSFSFRLDFNSDLNPVVILVTFGYLLTVYVMDFSALSLVSFFYIKFRNSRESREENFLVTRKRIWEK